RSPSAMPCNASPSTKSSPARRKSAFARSATKHPWNSRLYKLKETNLMCWSICLSWIFSIGHRGTDGKVKPLRVELIRPVRHRQLFEAHFESRGRFKAERNALVFRSSDLDRPFTTHNEELLKIVGAQLETEVQARIGSSDIGEQVKQTLRHSLAGRRPTLQHVAEDLHLSVRTLQR